MIAPAYFEEADRLWLAGVSFYGDPFQAAGDWSAENEIGRLWQRYFAVHERAPLEGVVHPERAYEIHFWTPESSAKGYFEVFVGQQVTAPQEIPVHYLIKVLPQVKYAVFELQGETITADWPQMIYRLWLPQSGLVEAYPFTIQRYDDRFLGLDRVAESTLEILVPVKQSV